MNDKVIVAIGLILIGMLCVGLPYMAWKAARVVNYKFSYEYQVKETVRKMVKEESLN